MNHESANSKIARSAKKKTYGGRGERDINSKTVSLEEEGERGMG